jgi:DNA-binding transcriptional LysR family regulator
MMARMKALDLEAVQAFVLVADLKSFTRTAEAMDSTQSAVSLKIKRLEDGLGRRLLKRTPRLVQLSAEGGQFLEAARALLAAHRRALGAFGMAERRLVVGISEHVVGAELPLLLRQVGGAEPELMLEMRVGSSPDLVDAVDRGMLDAAFILRFEDHRGAAGESILAEAFGWMGVPGFEWQPGEPLRVAAATTSCGIRNMAIDALDAAGIAWREVFLGGGVPTVAAAVAAGLAVAALSRRVAPPGVIDLGPQLGLPSLPAHDLVLVSRANVSWAGASLRTLAAAIRATA